MHKITVKTTPKDIIIIILILIIPFIIRFILKKLYFYDFFAISFFMGSIYIISCLPKEILDLLGCAKSMFIVTQIIGIFLILIILLVKQGTIKYYIDEKTLHGLIELTCVLLGIISTYFSIYFGNVCGKYIKISRDYINVISELLKLSILISIVITISLSFMRNINDKWLSQVIVNFCGPIILMTTSFLFGISISTVHNENIKLIFVLASLLLLSAVNTIYYAFGAIYYYNEKHIDFLIFFFSVYCLLSTLYLSCITKYKSFVLDILKL